MAARKNSSPKKPGTPKDLTRPKEKAQQRKSAPRRSKKLQAVYDRIRREFSAADLQKYTEIEEMIPAEAVIAEMERLYRQSQGKNKKMGNHAPSVPTPVQPAIRNPKEASMRKEKIRKQRHSPEDQAIYDRIRREFSASDLQKYTVVEKGVPLEKVIKKMEAIHRKLSQKKRT
jgi:hypothetical protein